MQFPPPPNVPESQRVLGNVFMRYEDVAQDGTLKVGGMPHAIDMVGFRKLWRAHRLNQETRMLGIAPILSRTTMKAIGGPISVRNAIEVEGSYQLGHTRDASGQVNRVVLVMRADLFAPRGHTRSLSTEAEPTERVHAGSVHAEHVFTRPWGPLDQRKVLALPLASGPYVPPDELSFREPSATLELPEGASWLEPKLALDQAPLAFGLSHTDSNQHVNSLVYPQLFEDAALRRMQDLGRDTKALLVDHIEIAFRKPCFAGQRMVLWVRSFSLAGKLGAVGYISSEGSPPNKAHCICALTFREGELPR